MSTTDVVRDTTVGRLIDVDSVKETVPDTRVNIVMPPAEGEMMASKVKRFHVIVASQPTRALAEQEVKHFRSLGHPETKIVFKDGVHYRVSIASFPTKREALDNLPFYSRKLKVHGVWVTYY
ncbi:MAG: SPOR domain-containing protein [Odoribacteraceae bacterium]|nr:SPOR domain-containing protein [Odoribacteraceae bacterium]